MDALVMPWVNARVAHLLLVCRMMTIGVDNGQEEKFDVNDYDSLMCTQKGETIEPFSSHIVSVKTGKAYVGECINIMVQALWTQDGSLPQGLTIQNTYTKLRKGSKKAVVVVWNNTTYPQTLWKKTPVASAVVALPVPELPEGDKLEEKAGKFHSSHTPVLTVRQRHDKLFDKLDLSSLESWTLEFVDTACQLLGKYHDVFSLDPAELGCTHSKEHIIKGTDDTPFKQWFRQILPLMVEEARNHLKEMLESGAIRPSQSVWCNALVLVQKKRERLAFLYQFLPHKHSHKKGFPPPPKDTRGTRKPGGCRLLFLPRSQIQILADKYLRDI